MAMSGATNGTIDEVTAMAATKAASLTLGPVLFNWQPERWRDFYFRIADEAPVETVYLGEAVCSKRAPLFDAHFEVVAARLEAAGKTVVLSTLAEVFLDVDRRLIADIAAQETRMVEVNDASALHHLGTRPHGIGPFMNVYNERTVAVLARSGATNIALPVEMPANAIRELVARTQDLGVTFEVTVFGRMPLALSARCYHARVHGRTRNTCRYVCEEDPDGMVLKTLEGRPFLTVNGIQTLSYECLNLAGELAELGAMGIARFRLSPQSADMVAVASVYRNLLDHNISAGEAAAMLDELSLPMPFANGFYHGKPGHQRVTAAAH
jgi:O2-independent ubiquinone biosynthesis protein UbiV